MVELDSAAAGRFGCARGAALAMEASLLGADPDVGARWESFVATQRGAMSGSAGGASSGEDAAWCFEEAPAASGARGSDMTACVVKPHVVKEGRVGELVGEVQALGFRVEAMGMLSLDLNSATAFFEVYKGVLPHYAGMVGHMAEGPVVFLGLSGGPGVVDEFREACGPPDVELARTLRPKSLRARFGTDRVKNAVHCTDLSVDGGLEVGYFMQLLGL